MTTSSDALTPEELAEGWTEDEWVYVGRRYDGKKMWHHFLDHLGKSRGFAKSPPGPVVGARYRVQSKAGDDGGIRARVQGATYAGSSTATYADKINEWRFQDRAAVAQQEADRARKRAAADNGDFGDLTLAQVRRLMVGYATTSQRSGMVAAVLSYIERGM